MQRRTYSTLWTRNVKRVAAVVLQLANPVRLLDVGGVNVDVDGIEQDGQCVTGLVLVAVVEAVNVDAVEVHGGLHVHLCGNVVGGVLLEGDKDVDELVVLVVGDRDREGGDDIRRLEGVELELGHDAEGRPGSAQGPEQIGVLRGRGLYDLAAGNNNGRFDDPIKGQTVSMRSHA